MSSTSFAKALGPIESYLEEEADCLTGKKGFSALYQSGVFPSAIVLGVCCNPEEWIDYEQASGLSIVRRSSGGGAVVLDSNSLIVSLLGDRSPPFLYADQILLWATQLYRELFEMEDFGLNEHDFVLGHEKIGGNALYLKRDRWLLHTSFLWDYSLDLMRCLRHPPREPRYRLGRSHASFLGRLCNRFDSKDAWFLKLESLLHRKKKMYDADCEK